MIPIIEIDDKVEEMIVIYLIAALLAYLTFNLNIFVT